MLLNGTRHCKSCQINETTDVGLDSSVSCYISDTKPLQAKFNIYVSRWKSELKCAHVRQIF
jgi:hypothetical protein